MISHHHKCIFVHIPKNAGQSVEHVFVNLLDLNWETRAPLLLRYNDRPELGPPRLAHLTSQEYVTRKYLPQEMFDRYFKFSFVRNPWGRMVSIYSYLGFDKKYEFKTFMTQVFRQEVWEDQYWFVRPQCDFLYSDNDELLVDFVGRFENLQGDFNVVCEKLKLPLIDLPHVNQSSTAVARPSRWPRRLLNSMHPGKDSRVIPKFKRYQDYYDTETKEVVTELYGRDIALLGYAFD